MKRFVSILINLNLSITNLVSLFSGETNPCAHGGTCINTKGSYMCKCTEGFTGKLCEININECASNPCANDATCMDKIGKFECVCMSGKLPLIFADLLLIAVYSIREMLINFENVP